MERKQIYLALTQQKQLRELASREHLSESEIIRRALNKYLIEHMTPDVRPEDHPIWSIIGIIDDEDAPTDGSATYKRDLYGREKL